MSTSCCLIKCSSRSSGPSNLSSRTGYASRMDSKSCWYSILESHGAPHALHRFLSDGARLFRPFVQQFDDHRGLRHDCRTARADRLEMRIQRFGKLGLHLDVAYLAGAIPLFQIVDLRLVGIESVVVREHRIAFDRPGDVCPHPLGVGVHLHDLLAHGFGIVRQIDRIAVALRHLAIVESRETRKFGQQRFGFDEQLPVEVVKAANDLATQFEVSDLVFSNGDELGVIDDDVRRLQQRIAEETQRREILLGELLHLLLVGRHPFQPRDRNRHREQQEQLRMLRDERLNEQRRPFRIDSRGDPVGRHLVRARYDLAGVGVVARQRMPIGNEIEAIVLILKRRPVIQCADKMSEVQLSCRAHARNHTRLHSVVLIVGLSVNGTAARRNAPRDAKENTGKALAYQAVQRPSRAKCASTESAAFAPTTFINSSRVARRTPARLPNAVSSNFRRRGPIPLITSSSDRRSRLVRDRRWKVTAKRCASSRIRWMRRSAGLSVVSAIGSSRSRVNSSSSFFAMPTATRFPRPSSWRAAYADDNCPLPPSMRIRSGNGPPASSSFRYRRSTTSCMAAKSSFTATTPGCGIWDAGSEAFNLRAPSPVSTSSPLLNESASDRGSRRTDPEKCPLILNFRYSDRFILPSSQTTIEATVSLP